MCQVFISADPQLWAHRARSIRLHGVATSIRLENLFWAVLEEIAGRDDLTVVQLIERLYDELVDARGAVGNFASFLRVTALRYEALMAAQRIPADREVPIRSLDAAAVLRELPPGWGQPATQPASANSSARAWAAAKSSAPV